MNFLPKSIAEYAEQHTTPESPVLQELNRETYLKVLVPQMLSGHLQGAALQMLSQMIRPKTILEIGTFTGYSAICLAQGLQEEGCLHTMDINEELADMQQRYFQKANLQSKIKQYIGNALDIIPTIDATFDLVFIDADKINYSNYYHLVFDQLATGGVIIVDNVLWSGKVLQDKKDEDTQAIADFNRLVQEDDRVTNVLFPIRDGMMLIRKK